MSENPQAIVKPEHLAPTTTPQSLRSHFDAEYG